MSEDRIDQGEAKDDDVEAHRRRHLTDELKETDDDNESDDFELHRRRA